MLSFKEPEIFKIENVLFKVKNMIPNDDNNYKQILKEVMKAENIVSKGIDEQQKEYDKDKKLKGASYMQVPPAGIIFSDKYSGIKNICKKFGLTGQK